MDFCCPLLEVFLPLYFYTCRIIVRPKENLPSELNICKISLQHSTPTLATCFYTFFYLTFSISLLCLASFAKSRQSTDTTHDHFSWSYFKLFVCILCRNISCYASINSLCCISDMYKYVHIPRKSDNYLQSWVIASSD